VYRRGSCALLAVSVRPVETFHCGQCIQLAMMRHEQIVHTPRLLRQLLGLPVKPGQHCLLRHVVSRESEATRRSELPAQRQQTATCLL